MIAQWNVRVFKQIPLSLDEAYLDVTENKTGLPTATLVARTIREQIRQELNLTASAGVATNKFLAKLASDWRKPDGLFVIQPDDIDAFLLPLPVGRLPGVGKVTGEKLAKRGIQTVGDLRGLELPALEGDFGSYGIRLYNLSRGVDRSEVVPLSFCRQQHRFMILPWHGRGRRFDPDQVHHFQPLTASFSQGVPVSSWSANQCGWRFSRKASTPSTASGCSIKSFK